MLAHIDHIGTQIIPRLAIGAALCDVPATGLPSIPSHPWRYGSKLWMLKVLLRIRGTRHWKQCACRYFVANHCITDHSAPKPQASVVPSVVTPSGASCKRPTVGKPKTGCWGMGKGTATCSECCWFLCVCSFASLFFDLFRIAAFSLVLRSQRDHESNGFMFWDRLHQQVGKRTY